MNSKGAVLGSSAAAAALVLVGATLNGSGRAAWAIFLAAGAGLLAGSAGVFVRRWRLSVPLAGAALVITLLTSDLLQTLGLILIGAGAALGADLYRRFQQTVARQTMELRQKHLAFLAATSDAESAPPADLAALTSNIARQVGADFACCYLVSTDATQFVPQLPGVGLDGLHPSSVQRPPNGGAGSLLIAVEAGRTFAGQGNGALKELFNFLPEGLAMGGTLAAPMPVGDRIGGFMLLGSRVGVFTDDDRRLASTLTLRAAAQLASANAIAMS